MLIYNILAEWPGVARGQKKIEIFIFFLALDTPRLAMSVHKKFQPNRSSRLAGIYVTYTNVLFIV